LWLSADRREHVSDHIREIQRELERTTIIVRDTHETGAMEKRHVTPRFTRFSITNGAPKRGRQPLTNSISPFSDFRTTIFSQQKTYFWINTRARQCQIFFRRFPSFLNRENLRFLNFLTVFIELSHICRILTHRARSNPAKSKLSWISAVFKLFEGLNYDLWVNRAIEIFFESAETR
jgi:hypothetical protein